MISYEDECVGCPPEMGCLGDSCPNRNVKRFYCDWCEEGFSPTDLRYYNNKYICKDCYLEQIEEKWESMDKVDEDDE